MIVDQPPKPPEIDNSSLVYLRRLNAGHVFGESVIFLGDLEGEFSGVTKDENGNLAVDGLQLLQRRQDEHRRLTHTTLRLTDHVHPEDCLAVNNRQLQIASLCALHFFIKQPSLLER